MDRVALFDDAIVSGKRLAISLRQAPVRIDVTAPVANMSGFYQCIDCKAIVDGSGGQYMPNGLGPSAV